MQALLFTTHRISPAILARYDQIQVPDGFDKFLIIDNTNKRHVVHRKNVIYYKMNDFIDAGFKPMGKQLVPGNNHFPVLTFSSEHPQYKYIWVMEYDVVFTGNWKNFFNVIDHDADLISTYIRTQSHDPWWYWWRTYENNQHEFDAYTEVATEVETLTASFNPFYRISQQAALAVNRECLSGVRGHQELVIPTVLEKYGMKLAELETVLSESDSFKISYSRNTFDAYKLDHLDQLFKKNNTFIHPAKLN